jgi:hypothetical protein
VTTTLSRADRLGLGTIVALALLLWLPRLSGPIDLRYDAGVYYLLGTSLAAGDGYRLPNEPGAPEAVQYPPLLPALVACHQLVLGSSDVEVVGPWLRRTYALMFVVYAALVFALARVYLGPIAATVASTLCVLHLFTYYLSDLLFAELPFALLGVAFALVLARESTTRPHLREAGAGVLGAAAFLLRTAGIALLAAWVAEALLRRRWRLALVRGAVALVPLILWQAHVASVKHSPEYSRPAYEYQRAPYQFYNVTYAENALLVDPFRPELGHVTAGAFAARVATNVATMPTALGEASSAPFGFWLWVFHRMQDRTIGVRLLPNWLMWGPILALGLLVLGGIALLARRGAWSVALITVASIALVCSTPWPGQFTRYLAPLTPFLVIALMVALGWVEAKLAGRGPRHARPTRIAIVCALALTIGVQAYTAGRTFLLRHREGATFVAGQGFVGSRLFYYDPPAWGAWQQAAAWVGANAPQDAVVATAAPHLLYLSTGHRAVFPPMESDPEVARRLLDGVPISYVIVDQLPFLDVTRHFALPAVAKDPDWRLVYEVNRTRVYERVPSR